MSKLSQGLLKIFRILFGLTVGFLFISSLFVTATHEVFENGGKQEFAHVTQANFLISIVMLVCGIVFLFLFNKLLKNHKDINVDRLTVIVSFISLIISIIYINTVHTVPAADQEFCVKAASEINAGNFHAFEKGNYLSNYPHLLGFVALERLLFKIFGDGNFASVRYLNALMVPLIVFFGSKITGILSDEDKRARVFFLFFSLTCLPIIGYTLYVYGDMLGIGLSVVSIYMFLKAVNTGKVGYYIGLAVSILLMIPMRKMLIVVPIAMLVVTVLRLIRKFEVKEIIISALIIISLVASLFYPKLFYLPEKPAENASVPTAATIDMGFNVNGDYYGWYNYYELDILYANDCDEEFTRQQAFEEIKTIHIPNLIKHHKFAANFYFNKINSQWQSPMFQAIVSNDNLYGLQNEVTMSIFFGKLGAIFDTYMKAYQILFYLCMALYILFFVKKEEPIENYVIPIAMFGGFLVQLLWEAKARYCFPYFVLLLPIFAVSAKKVADSIKVKLKIN
ncbi:MAG: hypothetical protein K6A29_03495 [Lachnospiraceae bacterium]|nr:hypothetical protein [Lachnospiraceae bacterium]